MRRKLTLTTPIITEHLEDYRQEDTLHNQSDEANLEIKNVDNQQKNQKSETTSQCNSSFNQTVSQCSKLSRITMDMAVYRGIFINRDTHNIFSYIDEDINISQWFYISSSGDVKGPFDSFEMDSKFKDLTINDITKLKRDCDDDYFPLSRLVKRYYRNVLAYKHTDPQRASNLSNKMIRFRKGTITSSKRFKPERLEINGREERVVSALPRPTLVFLNNAVNSSDDDSEPCTSRVRSQTLAN